MNSKSGIKIYSFLIWVYFFIGIVPYFFMMMPGNDAASVTLYLNSKLRFLDVFLVIFAVIALYKNFVVKNRSVKKWSNPLLFLILFLLLVVAYSSISFGINAFGEFRYTFIIIFLPLYITLTFEKNNVKKFLPIFIITYLLIAASLYIILSVYTGWGLLSFSASGDDRIFPSDISLGVLLSAIFLFLGKKYNKIKISSVIYRTLMIASIFMIILDNHRSVWLTALIILMAIVYLKEIKLSLIKAITILVPLFIFSIVLLNSLIISFIPKLNERLLAFTDPERDATASWRMLQWTEQLQNFYNHPFLGEGLGGYWGLSDIKGDLGVMPHNMYVIILVKLGVIGLLIFLVVLVFYLRKFKVIINNNEGSSRFYALVGIISTLVIFSYSIAYALDFRTTWLFLGLSIAYFKNEDIYVTKVRNIK